MQSVLHALISNNEQLGQRAEHFAQLLVEHDKTLDALFDQLGKTVPEIRKEIDARLVNAVPGLVSEAYSKYNEELDARCRAAVSESQGKLESVRAEIVAMAAAQFTEAEKQIGLTAEQIEARILGALTGAATERIEKLERGLVIEIQHAINAALPKKDFAAAQGLIDSYRGQWREGMVAQRGDLFSWYGSTYLALEDTNDTPGRKNIGRDGAKWAVIAARGAGGGGGGGGDSLPSQTGNAGKFLKTDGNSTLWETIPGGGDMLGANNLTDVASVTAAFANIKQAATTTASGVVTFATSGESAALKAVQANDARLSDSRTPTTHASTHQTGGSDPIDFPVDSVFGATNTITQVDYLALNVSSTVAVTTAKIVWNATESTGELGFNASVNTLLGMDVHAQVYNQSGSPFTKGQVVRVDGSSGTRLKASLALATNDANSSQTFGLVAQTIGNNASGVIITQGLLRAIDTNAYNTGDTLWLSATTPGAMVNVRPVAPYHGVRVGYVVKKAGSADGIIFVDVQNGLELEELHDVAITAVANNDIIAYNASTTVWRNRQLFDSTSPAALAVSATAGVSVTAARVDHVHARPTFDELTISGEAQGDILYRSATSWARLPAATAGYILQTNGAAANPSWAQNTGGSGAPTDAEYIVASANGSLSAERVLGNSTSITANFATGGQVTLERAALTGDVTASQNSNATTIANGVVSTAKMGGDVTTAGKALLDDADAAAQRTTLGLGTLATQSGTFSGTSSGTNTGDQTISLTGDVVGSGTGSFTATITVGAVNTSKLGGDITTAGKALLDDADAAAQRTTLGLGSLATQSGTFSGTSSGTNTGDQTITLTGDVTGSGTGSFAATIANDAVSNAKLANVATSTIKGRVTAGTGDPEDLTSTQATTLINEFTSSLKGLAPASGGGTTNYLRADGTWAQPPGTGGGGAPTDADYLVKTANGSLSAERVVTDSTSITVNWATAGQVSWERAALTGDVTASQNSNSTTIANDAVTNAKLANMTASTIKARVTASTGDPEDASLTQVLDLVGSVTYGDILYRDSTSWARLPAGTSGNFLKTQGAGAAPTWAAASGGGGGSTNLWIAASQWIPRTTTGVGVNSTETTTNRQNFDELLFDAGTDEFAQALVVMPSNYNAGTVTGRFYWTASSGSGAVVWGLQGLAYSDDDALDTATGTAQTVTDTLLAANDMMISGATSSVTIGGTPGANKAVQFQIYRDADAGGDTLAVDARLLGVEISYTSS
jgi:hypothetical protein